jgi:hypothetical protein
MVQISRVLGKDTRELPILLVGNKCDLEVLSMSFIFISILRSRMIEKFRFMKDSQSLKNLE